MTPALKTILSNTYSRTSLKSRLSLLRDFLEFQFFSPHANPNLFYLINEYFLAKNISRDEFNAFMTWDYSFFNQFSKESFYAQLQHLEEEATKMPLIRLFLPFNPPVYEVPKLGIWFRENIAEDILVDIKLDPNLIGGCALVWKDVYHDFSLRYYLEKNKAAVKNEIERFLIGVKETTVV